MLLPRAGRLRFVAMLRATIVTLWIALLATGQQPGELATRIARLAELAPEARLDALTSVADDLLFCDRAGAGDAVAALRQLAADELFYSPSANEPSLLWFQYERALRRGDVRAAGRDPAALIRQLDQLRIRRATLLPIVAQMGGGQGAAPSVFDLARFGWHGAGEVLEAIADLAAREGTSAAAVGAELANYLACERPRPSEPHVEGSAGLAETPPTDTPARHFPVLWGDDYRFALARAVLAIEPPETDLEPALLHLLYSPARAERLDAITRLRLQPLSPDAVTHLAAQLSEPLDDGDRLVVREAITALGSGGAAATAARESLQRLAAGEDRELRAVAARALEQLASGSSGARAPRAPR
ncbi:MAG: hypothetical protein KDE27_04105 [Planctomycetes bacterium]|nr:hypothetical protein [Planctomycetota bacterium]